MKRFASKAVITKRADRNHFRRGSAVEQIGETERHGKCTVRKITQVHRTPSVECAVEDPTARKDPQTLFVKLKTTQETESSEWLSTLGENHLWRTNSRWMRPKRLSFRGQK